MNLQKKCKKCHDFFPAKPMELSFFCDKPECQKYSLTHNFWSIKSQRYISMDNFDIYDLDRPTKKLDEFERVCRQCGKPLFNKNGKYSYHRRYCIDHNGNLLFNKYNWGSVSKRYAHKVAELNKELIKTLNKHGYNNLTICEECKKICTVYDNSYLFTKPNIDVINIHHIFPVHKITMENIHLIWDFSNLKALCYDCHRKQNHFLKKIKIQKQKFLSISSFL